MKQYLLLLRSSDFSKNGNVWTSNPVNLYVNSQYNNYSYLRSIYGLNYIGDRTYVGVEQTSPNALEESTPFSNYAIYKTDAGEVVYDPATPDLLRFIDTSSRVDILSYRHTFTNLSGTLVPTFNLTVYESDDYEGPWLTSSISGDTNVIFIKNSKPFIKIELEIFPADIDLTAVGLVFYLEIGIHEITSPVISKSVKNIAKQFPSWTDIYADSVESTPSLQVPESVGGKFLTALLQENLDNILADIELNDINSFIDSADENMPAWVYASYNVPQNINTVFGDSVELARTSSMINLISGKNTDYAFYYNPIDRTFFTLRNFSTLSINGSFFDQEPVNVFNDFDEFGARVGLPRLYLESNSNYKKRIFDVTANIPAIHSEGLKRTLRRELDIWRAYGATPDSSYLGATPEILEISDIETSTPYFNDAGIPQKDFKTFVRNLNNKYPSNWGYVKWDEGIWDYAGKMGEGVSRIPAIYDPVVDASNLYHQGVGDFDDAKLILTPNDAATVSFDGIIKINGWTETTPYQAYSPILVDYNYYAGYTAPVSDYEASKTGVALVYEISLPPHANYATPSVFYANLNYQNRNDFYVGNYFSETSEASPEGSFIRIFDDEGMSLDEIIFRDKVYDQTYLNTDLIPYNSNISIYDAASVNLVFGKMWDGSSYQNVAASDYRVAFSGFFNEAATGEFTYYTNPISGTSVELASPDTNPLNASLIIGSDLYPSTSESFTSDVLKSSLRLNYLNEVGTNSIVNATIYPRDLINSIVFQHLDATPTNLYIDVAIPYDTNTYLNDQVEAVAGGITKVPGDPNYYLVPSSPNIKWIGYNISDVAVTAEDYFDSATISYSSTPYYIDVFSANGDNYPINVPHNFDFFSAETTPTIFSGFIDEVGRVHKDEQDYLVNNFLIQDRFLETISLNRNSFGLVDNVKYIVNSIEVSSTPDYVVSYFDNNDVSLLNINRAIINDETIDFDIYSTLDNEKQNRYQIGMNSGWVYYNEEDRYIYVNPESATYNGQFFDIELDHEPRMFAPVIAKVNDQEYRKVVFEDSATPGLPSFWNTETVIGNNSNSLYLAYTNVKDISVKDLYTGKNLFNGLSTSSNVITPFDEATPSVNGRQYEVIYYVNEAFYVDKDIYDPIADTYSSKLYFSTTPDIASNYYLTYEKDYLNQYIPTTLSLNQTELSVNEGFVFISDDEFNFNSAKVQLSPKSIDDTGNDLMYLSIISYDENGNFKPHQTFRVYGANITADDEYLTTNENGFAVTIIRYSGSIPSSLEEDTITIEGIGSATPNGNSNSDSGGYWAYINYRINRSISYDLKLRAVPGTFKSESNDSNVIGFVGLIEWKDKPFKHAVDIGWAQARTLYDLFDLSPTHFLTTNADGTFAISEDLLAHDETEPGHWFVKIEILETASTISSMLAIDGETIDPSNITITGDVIYWNERYDSFDYSSGQIPLPYTFIHEKQIGSDLIATPSFVYRHYDGSGPTFVSGSTPNWVPPKWVPLRKFDQYQMQIFGTTPNYIIDYGTIHPDNGEE